MTNIHVWTPLHYKFEGLLACLQAHPDFKMDKKIFENSLPFWIDKWKLVWDLYCCPLWKKSNFSSRFCDDEVEEGCGLETLDIFIKHLINLTRIHTQTYFMFADLIDYLYLDATYSAQELTNFKRNTSEFISGSASKKLLLRLSWEHWWCRSL